MMIMSVALLGTVLIAAFFHGFAVVTGDASFFTLFNAGGQNAVQVLADYSDAESSFYYATLLSALIMGSVAVLIYQKTVSQLGQFRQWARTASRTPPTSRD